MKPINRQELLISPEYWEERLRLDLFAVVQNYLEETGVSRKELADKIGVSKGYITQVLNGDSDHRLSKVAQLALATGKVPFLIFLDLDRVIECDKKKIPLSQYQDEYVNLLLNDERSR